MSDTRYPTDSGVSIRDAKEPDIPAIQDIARLTWADTYRDVIPEDAQAAVLDRAYSKESLAVSIGRNQAFLVAEVGSTHAENSRSLAGYIDLDFGGRQMNLHRLYILPEYQRLGLGRKLLQAAIARAISRAIARGTAQMSSATTSTPAETDSVADKPGSPSPSPSPSCLLVAHVERDNPKARAFYKKMGFAEDEEEIVVIGGVSLPVVRISMTVGGEANAL